ncbi:glycosyltransferase family 2 protein [Novipirellula sp. SH528]|uniref:glycosyltransferase family 2 protein n=1 Tax=Novipirellula sp. SH528 TaxID=3454466 RepID=UPI003F9F1604
MTTSTNLDVARGIVPKIAVSTVMNRSRGSVSVVIPTHNCARYIGGALQSVARQSYSDLEIIVVDDRSTDETRAAITSSGVPCTYVKNLRSPGPAGARNHGILQSKGEYIAFLDADDAWLPNKLAVQIAAMQSDPKLVALGGVMIPWDSSAIDVNPTPAVCTYAFDDMLLKNRLGTPTVICRRESLVSVGMFDESMSISEDYELWLRLCWIGTVGRIAMPMARFRQRTDGLSAGDRDRTFALDWEFTRSLAFRYPDVPGIQRLVNQGLSSRLLERAIELCDEEKRYGAAFSAAVNSIWNWPWTHPCQPQYRFTRLRRIRRILLNMLISLRRRPVENVDLEQRQSPDFDNINENSMGVPSHE